MSEATASFQRIDDDLIIVDRLLLAGNLLTGFGALAFAAVVVLCAMALSSMRPPDILDPQADASGELTLESRASDPGPRTPG